MLYNLAMDALCERRFGLRVDPIDKLPNDIITGILMAISGCSPLLLLQLTLVSRKWQNFILYESTLWNHVEVSNRYDETAIISVQVHLSRHFPLMIELSIPAIHWDSIRSILLENQHRIDTIESDLSGVYESSEPDRGMWDILDDLGTLSNMRRLSFPITSRESSARLLRVLDRYPSLSHFPRSSLNCDDLQIAKGRLELDALDTFEDIRSILPILETIHSLKSVVFYSQHSSAGPDTRELMPAHDLPWTNLCFHAYSDYFPLSILRRLSSLVRLEVNIGMKIFSPLVTILHQLQHLELLSIIVRMNKHDTVPSISALSPNINVHHLQICIHDYDVRTSNPVIVESNNQFAKEIEIMIKSALQLTPKIDALDIYLSIISWSIPLFDLTELFSGTKLSIILPYGNVECLNSISVPSSTAELDLACDGVVSRCLSSNTLKSLLINEADYEDTTPGKYSPLTFDLSNWPALQKLACYGNAVEWSKYSLTFLRTVRIWTEKTKPIGNRAFTSFIKDIACYPYSYPTLEEIELAECPELDILMIMLERRNLLQDPTIKKIKEISFRSPCSLGVQRTISTLLGGKWAERPSNKELSLAGNAEILLDLTLPGCYMCHRGLRFCDTVVESTPKDHIQGDLLTKLQHYPEDEDEILSTWKERVLLWDEIDRNGAGRLMRCRWSANAYERISADSF
ncbi:hypothetical protein CPB86DRAFT_757121 [Serendipita vermifera]|nr:hypothetical protein CPB86DRAFT_757121 [Serendipita vermifera]